MIEPRDEFAPLINSLIAGAAVWIGGRVWTNLSSNGKFVRLAAAVTSTLVSGAAVYAVKGLF